MSEQFAVSIIIPFHNRADLTTDCLRSISRHTRDVSCEVILIDDASTEPFDPAPHLSEIPWRVIRNEQRNSFSANNNMAARSAAGMHLCLLNNDTLVRPGWLSALVRVMEQETNVGVLGNKHLFPDSGMLQHAGMAADADCEPYHLHPGSDPDLPAVNYQRDLPAVTFACVLIPRGVYENLGGLDESYRNGYEDVDFCLRAARAGYRIVYTPASVIAHYGQSTPGRTVTDESNRQLFRERWGAIMPRNYGHIAERDRAFNTARKKNSEKRRPGLHFVLDCSKPCAFTWAGVELVMALLDQGTRVSLPVSSSVHPSIPRGYAKRLRRLFSGKPNQTYHVKWSHYWPEHFRVPLAGEVNAEMFCTNYAYPDPGKALDLWTRHVLLNEYRKLPVSGFNDHVLRTLGIPSGERRIVPLGYSPEIELLDPDARRLKQEPRDNLNILLMTNSHDLYRYGTDLAVAALARAFGPDDKVVVHVKDYGAGASSLLEQWIAEQEYFPEVRWHREFLSKEDLIRLYAAMDVQLSPFRGEGFAMKILDAMAVGVPCIMPLYGGPGDFCDERNCLTLRFTEAPVGQCYDRENYYLGDGATWCEPDLEDLTDTLVRLPGERDGLVALGQSARSHVRGAYTWKRSARLFMDALEGWGAHRLAVVSRRNGPDRRDLSVVIPTKDRPDQLAKTLAAYGDQTLPADRFEIILVNDHGDKDALGQVVAGHPGLNIEILDNHGPGGPGAARNLGIDRSSGHVLLITGDDIVPTPGFLETHLAAHRKHPAPSAAFVGNSPWHPDLGASPFLNYLTGEGGEQFKYDDMQDGKPVPFSRFYTSNVSVKRTFLAEQETLFSSHYRFAAFEDVELGYRLHLRGMVLHYLESAVGLHQHPTDPQSFLQRQYKVGRMLTVLAIQRPCFIPDCHYSWLRALELLRCSPEHGRIVRSCLPPASSLAEHLVQLFSGILDMMNRQETLAVGGIAKTDMDQWIGWMDGKKMHLWTAANELILRKGLVDEWAGGDEELAKAGNQWVEAFVLPRLLAGQSPEWDVPLVPNELVPASLAHRPRLRRLYTYLLNNRMVQDACRVARSTRAGSWVLDSVRSRIGG